MRQRITSGAAEKSKPNQFNIFTGRKALKPLAFGVQLLPWDFVSAIAFVRPATAEVRDAPGQESTDDVRAINEEAISKSGEGCAEQLSRFFPGIAPAEIPASVSAARSGSTQLNEAVVLEFCGQELAIFRTALPLEYNDAVRLVAKGIAGQLDARVVAVQYHEGLKAVAVRFESGPRQWVTTT